MLVYEKTRSSVHDFAFWNHYGFCWKIQPAGIKTFYKTFLQFLWLWVSVWKMNSLFVCYKNKWFDLRLKLVPFFVFVIWGGTIKHSFCLKIFFGPIRMFSCPPSKNKNKQVTILRHKSWHFFFDRLTELAFDSKFPITPKQGHPPV